MSLQLEAAAAARGEPCPEEVMSPCPDCPPFDAERYAAEVLAGAAPCPTCAGQAFLRPSESEAPELARAFAAFLSLRATLARHGPLGVKLATGDYPSPAMLEAAAMLDGELERLWNEAQGRMLEKERRRGRKAGAR